MLVDVPAPGHHLRFGRLRGCGDRGVRVFGADGVTEKGQGSGHEQGEGAKAHGESPRKEFPVCINGRRIGHG